MCASNQEGATQIIAVIVPEENEIKNKAIKNVVTRTVKQILINQLLSFMGIGGIGRSVIKSATDCVVNQKSYRFI